jgi:endonuclease G
MKKLLFILLILVSFKSFSQTLPRQISLDDQIVKYNGFTISYNNTHEQPNWVMYTITPADLTCETKVKRKNKFYEDYRLQGHSAYLSDYKGSGYDRGHLKSSADESCDQEQNDETFVMSNMSPQHPSFNRGAWKKLETYVRSLAMENDSVVVITGGVLTDDLETIGENKVSVPKFYYKVIYAYKNGKVNVLCYNMPNEKITEPLYSYNITLKELEKFVGIDFP